MNLKLRDDRKTFGAEAFELEVLEELEMSEAQSPEGFGEDLALLKEIYLEKFDPRSMY